MTTTPRPDYSTTDAVYGFSPADDSPQRSGLPRWSAWSWAIALGALLAVGLPLIALRNVTQPSTYSPQKAEKAVPAQAQAAALGRLEPEGGVLDVGIPIGSIVEDLLVEEGDTVIEDQVLAYLNGYGERLANRDLIASQLAEARRQLQTSLAFDQAQVEAANVLLDSVGRPQISAVAAQEAILRQRTADYQQAKIELDRFTQLFQQGAISRQDYEQQESRANQLLEAINQAQATLTQLDDARANDIENAAAQLDVAQANLQRTQGQNQIDSIQQRLLLAEAQLEQVIIRAPKAGQVLRIFTHGGESAIENGMGGGTLLQMGDTDQMYVVAEVYEADASLVRPGQSATIVSRNQAFEGELTGTVEFIGQQIFKNNLLNDDPAAFDDARVVEVKIRLDDSAVVAAFTNLQVDVRIDVQAEEGSTQGTALQETLEDDDNGV